MAVIVAIEGVAVAALAAYGGRRLSSTWNETLQPVLKQIEVLLEIITVLVFIAVAKFIQYIDITFTGYLSTHMTFSLDKLVEILLLVAIVKAFQLCERISQHNSSAPSQFLLKVKMLLEKFEETAKSIYSMIKREGLPSLHSVREKVLSIWRSVCDATNKQKFIGLSTVLVVGMFVYIAWKWILFISFYYLIRKLS